MTYAVIALFWRKPGTTPEEFQHYCETVHVPLVVSLLGPDNPKSHTRFYVSRQHIASGSASDTTNTSYPANFLVGGSDAVDFDAMAHIVFEDEEAFKRSLARRRDPEVGAKIAADEEKFLLREKVVITTASEAFITLHPPAIHN